MLLYNYTIVHFLYFGGKEEVVKNLRFFTIYISLLRPNWAIVILRVCVYIYICTSPNAPNSQDHENRIQQPGSLVLHLLLPGEWQGLSPQPSITCLGALFEKPSIRMGARTRTRHPDSCTKGLLQALLA